MPPENTTLFFPTLGWNKKDSEEGRHKISKVTAAVTKSSISLSDSVTEDEFMVAGFKHTADNNVTTVSARAKLYPSESLHEGSRDNIEGGGGSSLLHLRQAAVERVAARRSSVYYWGSEGGVVHMGRWPRHKPKKHPVVAEGLESSVYAHKGVKNTRATESLVPHNYEERTAQMTPSTQEMTELSTHTYEESTTKVTVNTQKIKKILTQSHGLKIERQRMEEISMLAPEEWMTDIPGAEDWSTGTSEERLSDAQKEINNKNSWGRDGTEDWETITHEASSTEAPEEHPTLIPEVNKWSTSAPEEQLTNLPKEWLSTTPQAEDEWLIIRPQDEEQPAETHGKVHSASSFSPTLPSLSPTPSTTFPPTYTPTFPPSLPPTPSPQDAVEDSLRITTRGLDFLLEASPTGQSSLDITEFPKDDLFTLDLTITTTREGLKVDARDVTFDPSQIAKATSYEGSSYPTATRSATVTTTWVKEDHLSTPDHQNLTLNSDELVNLRSVVNVGESAAELQHQTLGSEDGDISTLSVNDELLMLQVNGSVGNSKKSEASENIHSRSDNVALNHPPTTEEDGEVSTTPTTPTGNTKGQEADEDTTVHPRITEYKIHQQETNTSGHNLGRLPVLTFNMTDARNDSESMVKGNSNRTEEAVAYEIPVVTRNPGQVLSPSVVVALSVCCTMVVVLAALSVALWVCRRHRNRSKIYLSQEAAKPRAFFTRPMNPAVLPEDSDQEDAVYMLEFQRPRPPIMLGDDQKGIYFIKRDEGKGSEECRESLGGVENRAFTDVPLGEIGDEGQTRLDPPKYDFRSKKDSDADSGIRVWSSTGSLHAASSPLPTHCRVPPPPYSPTISKESVCLTVHTLPSLPRNSQLFSV